MRMFWVMFSAALFLTGVMWAGIISLTPSDDEFAVSQLATANGSTFSLPDYDASFRQKLLPLAKVCKTCRRTLEFSEDGKGSNYPVMVSRVNQQTKVTYAVVVGVSSFRKGNGRRPAKIPTIRPRMEYYVCAPTGYCEVYDAHSGLAHVISVGGEKKIIGEQTPGNILEIQEVAYKNLLH